MERIEKALNKKYNLTATSLRFKSRFQITRLRNI
jgi:hypothetical protein